MGESVCEVVVAGHREAESLANKLRTFAADLTAAERALLCVVLECATADAETAGPDAGEGSGFAVFQPRFILPRVEVG